MIWHLALWTMQLALALTWHLSTQQWWWHWWISALAALICAAMVAWHLPQLYRRWLWRRRKSMRPSPEIQAERRRIAAALHDSLGCQLVHAMALLDALRNPALQQVLEQCLLDLRLIVDSMDAQDDALPLCMARFRHRLQAVLDRRRIHLHWDVWDPETEREYARLPRGQMAQSIMAVLQESVSNILQHAHANEVWITLIPCVQQPAQGRTLHARLCIEDNGLGLPSQLLHTQPLPTSSGGEEGLNGRGVPNMYRHAHEIGGELQICQRDGGGSRICLLW